LKFFKHFCDAHRGRSIQTLLDQLGHMGLTYWVIVEMCTEKLDEKLDAKKTGERLSESDCEFDFHQRILRQNLRVSATNLRKILEVCRTSGLLAYEIDGSLVRISMPKILKSLERTKKKDVKSTSGRRQSDVLEKEEEQEGNKEQKKDTNERAFEATYEIYPNKVGKSEGFERLRAQALDEADTLKLEIAAANYARYCALPWNDWYTAKNFDVWCGAKSKDVKPWRDWIDPDPSIFVEKPKKQFAKSGEDLGPWLSEAELFRKAIRNYGAGDPGVVEFLGEPRITWFRAIGRNRIGDMKDDDFARRDLAKMIRAEAQKSEQGVA